MKIEVGKKYKNRIGEESFIIYKFKDSRYREFLGIRQRKIKSGQIIEESADYAEDGSWASAPGRVTAHDLTEELE